MPQDFIDLFPVSTPKTSTSSSSITPITTLRLSMKPFTATLSIRFVVALYSVRKIVSFAVWTQVASSAGLDDAAEMVEKDLRTSGESSWSTRNAWRAADARRDVGRGRSTILACLSAVARQGKGKQTYNEQGNSGSET